MQFAEMLAKKVLGKELCREVFEEEKTERRAKKTCPNCGMTDREFLKNELLGCPKCCETFATELEEILLRMQHAKSHVSATKGTDKKTGEQPQKEKARKEEGLSEEQLRELIKDAVAKDDYETAAFARDILRGKTKKTRKTPKTPKKAPTRRAKKKDKDDG